MKFRRPGFFLSVFVFLLALPLSAQVNDTYVLPIVGNTTGAGNTRWITEFHLFNPQVHDLTVTLIFLPTHGAQAEQVEFDVDSNATAFSENILLDVFDAEGTGSLLVTVLPEENRHVPNEVLSRAILVNSRSYHRASIGTYGQHAPGVWTGLQDFNTDGVTAIASGIRNLGTVGATGYRTNIGAVNLGRYSATMYVNVYDDAGRTLRSQLPLELPPQGHIQDRLPTTVDHGSVEFFVDDPFRDAVVFAYASVVDNRTNDAVYIEPVLLASPGFLYGKKAAPAEVGKKIDSSMARRIAETAIHRGTLKRTEGGRLTR
jgi:hypothetical protein